MESYGRDLLEGNREGVANRYDRRGAYLLGSGSKEIKSYDSIATSYRTRWNKPASFEWQDLSFEPLGPDAVAVAGRFRWGRGTGDPLPFSYTAVLVRQDGVLRIRVEDESIDPRAVPRPPCPPDSTRR
jgi:hypothetical protein